MVSVQRAVTGWQIGARRFNWRTRRGKYTLLDAKYSLLDEKYSLFNEKYLMRNTLCSTQNTLYLMRNALCSTQNTLYLMRNTLCSTRNTLYWTLGPDKKCPTVSIKRLMKIINIYIEDIEDTDTDHIVARTLKVAILVSN